MTRAHLSGVLLIVLAAAVVLTACGGQSRFAAYMKRGEEYFAHDEYTKAGLEFRNALQIDPHNATALVMAGRTADKLGRLRQALGAFEAALDAAPGNLQAREGLARIQVLGGGAEQALKTLEPALTAHPEDAVLLTLRAAARAQLGNLDGAVADADHALRIDPTNTEAVEVRAGLYKRGGDVAGATALVSAAVQKAPRSLTLRQALADLYVSSGEPAKAEEQLRALIALAPQEPRYRYQLAAFYSRSHRLDDAQRVLQEAVAAMPGNDEVKLALVELISTQRARAQGEQVLRGFIAKDPDNLDLRLGLGALLQRAGATQEAADTYDAVVRRDGRGAKAMVARDRLAEMAWGAGRAEEASRLVGEVLAENPRDSAALVLHGEIALAQSNLPAAITDFRAVLRDQPQAVGVYRMLAQALAASGEPALADESLRAAIELAPGDPALRIDRAKVLLQLQRPDEAVAVLEDTAARNPSNVVVREELATAYLAKHDYAAAAATAQDLERLRPTSAAGPYLAGLAAEGAGRPDEAQRQLQRALVLQPRAFDALAALARLMLSRGEGAQAVTQVNAAAGQGPPDARVLNLLGEMYLAQHSLPAAIDAFTRANAATPGWWVPERNLALAKVAAHDVPGAITAYQAAIKAAPEAEQPVTELALLYEDNGQASAAIALYQDSYRGNPHSQIVANNLAVLLVRYRTDKASLDQARDLSASFSASSDSNLLDTNGWVHFKRAEYAMALPVLQRAVEREPNSRELHYHLGMAEWRSGNSAGARKDLETALTGSGRFAGADDARAALAALKSSG